MRIGANYWIALKEEDVVFVTQILQLFKTWNDLCLALKTLRWCMLEKKSRFYRSNISWSKCLWCLHRGPLLCTIKGDITFNCFHPSLGNKNMEMMQFYLFFLSGHVVQRAELYCYYTYLSWYEYMYMYIYIYIVRENRCLTTAFLLPFSLVVWVAAVSRPPDLLQPFQGILV